MMTSQLRFVGWSARSTQKGKISIRIYPLVISCSGETPCGYGSIPINTIFSGMNIHKSQLFWWFFLGFPVVFSEFFRPTDAAGVRQGPGDCRAQLGGLPARSVDAGTGHTTEDGVLHAADDGILCTTHGWLGHTMGDDGSYIWNLNLSDLIWSYLILFDLIWSEIWSYLILSDLVLSWLVLSIYHIYHI